MTEYITRQALKSVVRKIFPAPLLERLKGLLAPKCDRGRGVYIAPRVHLIGAAQIKVGDGSVISEGSWLNVNARETQCVNIDIGANCFIGRRNFFSSGGPISIGDYCLTTIDCKFISSSHVIDNPMIPIMSSGTTARDSIRVGANCFFGAGAIVLGNVQIGHGSVIGAGAQVMRDLPPFSVAIGNPAKVVKRFCFQTKCWIDVSLVQTEEQLEYPSEYEYLAILRKDFLHLSMPLVAASAHFGNL